jgi:hypothetical protein
VTVPIIPPDPVKLVIGWLTPALPDATVTKNRPNPLTGQVVTVRRAGGTRHDLVVDDVLLSFECFAPSDEAAADLAHATWGWLFAMAGQPVDGVQCYQVVGAGGPADLPLDGSGDMQRPRYVMSAQVSFRS